MTIKVTKVSLAAGDQPVILNYENDNGRPYKPCKSMRRVLVNVWGPDGNAFIGRSMTLYCDEKVQFGGLAVGGIRISHMSHIDAPVTMALTATRATRKPFTIKPLALADDKPTAQGAKKPMASEAQIANVNEFLAALAEKQGVSEETVLKELSFVSGTETRQETWLKPEEMGTRCTQAWAGSIIGKATALINDHE